MSDRIIPVLSLSCGALVTLYVGLVVTTISFATWQTQAVNSVRVTESSIGNLEANYYTTVNRISALDPATMGFVSPAQVEYVAEVPSTSANLSFNGN